MTKLDLIAAGVIILLALSSCSESTSHATASIEVVSTDTTCEVATTEAPTGTIRFEVQNAGSDVTEFYLYQEDGTSIVGEIEDIGPGLIRSLVVAPAPGSYVTACKPGMSGDGIRGVFTVTSAG